MSWTKTETITTTDQKTGKDHSEPMRTQSENKQTFWQASDHVLILLAPPNPMGWEVLVFWANCITKASKLKAKQGVSRFCSRAFDSSLAWVRVCTLDWKYKKPTLVLRPLADMFFALFSAFAMTALKLYRVCVRELACNMHFFLSVYTGCSAGIICSQFAMW